MSLHAREHRRGAVGERGDATDTAPVVPGKTTLVAAERRPPLDDAEAIDRTLRGALAAALRARDERGALAGSIDAGDYATAGRVAFAIRASLRRAITALDSFAHEDHEVAGARERVAGIASELAPLLDVAPAIEGRDAGSIGAELAWQRSRLAAGTTRPETIATAGASVEYPHRAVIERSFGRSIDATAHAGPRATAAADALDADAFAIGNHVVFGSADPGLFVAAHEAAHTLQNAAVVHRHAGTIGDRGGDPYEAHADAVATRVVAGASAADLLDGASAASGGVVRRHGKFDYIKWGDTPIGPQQYILENAKPLYQEVKARLLALPVVLPSEHVSFVRGDGAFLSAFIETTMDVAARDWDEWPRVARSLVRPEDLSALVDSGRVLVGSEKLKDGREVKTGPRRFYAQAARPVVDALLRRIVESLARVVPRYLAARCGAGVAEPAEGAAWPQPSPDAIAASSPCDWAVIRALCADDVIAVDAVGYRKLHGITAATPAAPRPRSTLGPKNDVVWDFADANTPNVIVIKKPADATAEQVSAFFYGSPQFAHKIVASPPYFGFPLDDIRELRTQRGLTTPSVNPFVPNEPLRENARDAAFGMLRGEASEQIALDQAGADKLVPLATDRGSLMRALERTVLALVACKQMAASFGLGYRLAEPIAYVQGKLDTLVKASDADVAKWAMQVEKQSDVVMRVGLGLSAIERQLSAMGISGAGQIDKVPVIVRTPLEHCANAFIDAAILSRHVVTATERVAVAERELELAPVASLELLLENIRTRIHATKNLDVKHNPVGSTGDLWADDEATQKGKDVRYSPHGALASELALRDELTAIRALVLARDPSAAGRIKAVYTAIEKLNVETQVGATSAALSYVMERYFKMVTGKGNHWVVLVGDMPEALDHHHDASRYHGVFSVAWGIYVRGDHERAQAYLKEKLGDDKSFASFLQRAHDKAEEIEDRIMIAKIAMLIGIVLVSMGTAAVAEGAVLAIGGSQVAAFITASAVEAATFTILDAKLLGTDDAAGTLIGNFAQNVATFGLLRAWRLRQAARVADDALAAAKLPTATRMEKLAAYALKGKELTGQGLIIAATSYVQMQVDALRKTGKFLGLSDIRDMGKQGLAMVLGIAVGARVFRTHFDELRKLGFKVTDDMMAKVDSIKSLAKSVEATKNPEQALELVRRDRSLLEDELALHGKSPGDQVPNAKSVEASIKQLDGAEMALALDEVVPGRSFMGTPEQLEPVIARLRKNGAEVKEVVDGNGRRYEVVDGDQRLTLHEARHYTTTRTGATVAKQPLETIEAHSVVGHVDNLKQGRDLIRRLVAGDRSALAEIGYDGFPSFLKTTDVEWGLGRRWDGKIAVVVGTFAEIDWSRLPHIRPMSHSHPLTAQTALGGDVSIGKFVDGDYDMAKLFPSAADIGLMARARIRDHHVHTPFVSRGGDRVGNPIPGDTSPTVDFVIERAEYVGRWASSENVGVYRAKLTARAGGKVIWRGEVFAVDSGVSLLYWKRPPLANSRLGMPGGAIRTMAGTRIEDPVPGWWNDIDPSVTPPGWTFTNRAGDPRPHPKHPGAIQLRTDVVAPDGSTGWIERAYDPVKKLVIMDNAFLDKIPKDIRYVTTGVPFSAKGSPLQLYLSARQMKFLGATFGDVKQFRMSTIQNIEALMQLESMIRGGKTIQEAISETHSVQYQTTTIQQSGHMITKVDVDMTKAGRITIDALMNHYRTPKTTRDKLFQDYGLTPTDKVHYDFDIVIDVVPHPRNP